MWKKKPICSKRKKINNSLLPGLYHGLNGFHRSGQCQLPTNSSVAQSYSRSSQNDSKVGSSWESHSVSARGQLWEVAPCLHPIGLVVQTPVISLLQTPLLAVFSSMQDLHSTIITRALDPDKNQSITLSLPSFPPSSLSIFFLPFHWAPWITQQQGLGEK